MPALTYLPVELIQLIAGWCPARDILALSQTCRHLNMVCNDAVVFEMSFKNHHPDITSSTVKSRSALAQRMKQYIDGPDRIYKQPESPRATWLCLAVAVSQMPEALWEIKRMALFLKWNGYINEEDAKDLLPGLIGFLASLPVWGCTISWPHIEHMGPLTNFFAKKEHQHHNGKTLLQLNFLHMMSNEAHQRFALSHNHIHETARRYCLAWRRSNEDMGEHQGRVERHTWAICLADDMAQKIRLASASARIGMFKDFFNRRIQEWDCVKDPSWLPSFRKIKFVDSWDSGDNRGNKLHPSRIPLPRPDLTAQQGERCRYFDSFGGDMWWNWYIARVRDLFIRLHEGEWCCSYVHSLQRRSFVEPTLEGIRFRRSKRGAKFFSICVPKGAVSGVAHILKGEGFFGRKGCSFYCDRRSLPGGHALFGTLTPLGICGIDKAVNGDGYFWLWRKEWKDTTTGLVLF
ncbi:hypothetical protein F4805DRAFT_417422, partial [Annulohypoxylon moriforme]